MSGTNIKPIEILLVEDNLGDVRLVIEALKDGKIANHLSVAWDGIEAMEFLHRKDKYAAAPRPDIVLMDLNMPRKNGHQVIEEMRSNPDLAGIPVAVLTTSEAEKDVEKSYDNEVTLYITKPLDAEKFMNAIRLVDRFWMTIVVVSEEGSDPN